MTNLALLHIVFGQFSPLLTELVVEGKLAAAEALHRFEVEKKETSKKRRRERKESHLYQIGNGLVERGWNKKERGCSLLEFHIRRIVAEPVVGLRRFCC